MDLWQYVALIPETWGVSLSANVVNPDEDFISCSLWNGLMNFEVVIHLEKKIYCTTYSERWNLVVRIYEIIKKKTDQNKYS